MVDLSIIIPSYKSKNILVQQLPVLLNWIKNWNFKTEIIVVVDDDNLTEYADALKCYDVSVTGYDKNRGKGYAVKFGFKEARGAAAVFTDADIPFSEIDMLCMANILCENIGKELWIIGDRTLPESLYFDHISLLRKAGSDFFLLLIKLTLGKDFADTQCGLKGFTVKAGERVFNKSVVNRFAFDFECLYIARLLKIDVIKIPVSLRNQSPSTVRIFKDGMKLLKDILKVIFYYKYE